MLKKLHQCKTFKELFEMMGTKAFEKMAAVILIIWGLIPVIMTVIQVFTWFTTYNKKTFRMAIWTDYHNLVLVVGVLTIAVAVFYIASRLVLNGKNVMVTLKNEPWHLFFIAMIIWAAFCTLISDDPVLGIFGSKYRMEGLITYFIYASIYICAYLLRNEKSRKAVFIVFVIAATIVALEIVIRDAGFIWFKRWFPVSRGAVFLHFNHAGYYLNLSIVCLFGLYLYEKKVVLRIIYASLICFHIYALLVNSTFGSYLGSCFALAFIIALFIRYYRKFSIKLLVPVFIMVGVSVASYMGFVPSSSGQTMVENIELIIEDTSSISEKGFAESGAGHGRAYLWRAGMKMIAKSPVVGYGLEQLDPELESEMNNGTTVIDRADNEFIQCAIYIGIPGLIMYLAALLRMFLHQWKYAKTLKISALIAAGCVFAYYVSAMFGNSMFYTTPYLCMFLGMVSINWNKEQKIILENEV